MTAIRVGSTLAALAMAGAIVYGLTDGSFAEEFSLVAELPWGRVSLIDLYLALLIGGSWIGWRERSAITAILWLGAVLTLGSFGLATYIAVNSWRADSVHELLVGPQRAAIAARRRQRRSE